MSGKFPACVLNIELDPADTDVNVHPSKTEVRFSAERAVFSAVHIAVKNALLNENSDNSGNVVNLNVQTVRYTENAEIMPETLVLKSCGVDYTAFENTARKPDETVLSAQFKHLNANSFLKSEKKANADFSDVLSNAGDLRKDVDFGGDVVGLSEEKFADFKVLGELFSTYIVCEHGNRLILVDKHAADERLKFDELKKRLKTHSQMLLEPLEINIDGESAGVLLEAADELAQIGLQIEACGSNHSAVKVTAVPTILNDCETGGLLEDIAKTLKHGNKVTLGELYAVDKILHTVACRSAVKAGDKSDSADIEMLARRVLEHDDVRFCPHGRPVAVSFEKRELEKKFKRII
jgi:DNA mismatch repair protein MutL